MKPHLIDMAKLAKLEKKAIIIVGVPSKAGAAHAGVTMGPAALRTANVVAILQELGHEVEDHGDIVPNNSWQTLRGGELAKRLRRVDHLCDWITRLQSITSKLLDEGRIPILLGGDHDFSIGSDEAIARHAKRQHGTSAWGSQLSSS